MLCSSIGDLRKKKRGTVKHVPSHVWRWSNAGASIYTWPPNTANELFSFCKNHFNLFSFESLTASSFVLHTKRPVTDYLRFSVSHSRRWLRLLQLRRRCELSIAYFLAPSKRQDTKRTQNCYVFYMFIECGKNN